MARSVVTQTETLLTDTLEFFRFSFRHNPLRVTETQRSLQKRVAFFRRAHAWEKGPLSTEKSSEIREFWKPLQWPLGQIKGLCPRTEKIRGPRSGRNFRVLECQMTEGLACLICLLHKPNQPNSQVPTLLDHFCHKIRIIYKVIKFFPVVCIWFICFCVFSRKVFVQK